MTWKKPTTGIILAAGMSTRFGKPKQLLRLKGKYLIEWVLDAVLNSHLENIILVLGYKNREIFEAISEKAYNPALQVVVNDRFSEGQSQSLLAGLRMVQKTFPSVMFLLGDQPMVDSRMINHLLDRFWESDKDICVPTFQEKRGNPTIFSKNLYNQLLDIKGDVGARNIIKEHPEHVLYVEIDNSLYFLDIDTEEDLTRIQKKSEFRNSNFGFPRRS